MDDLIETYAQRMRAAGHADTTVTLRCLALRRIDRLLQPHGLDGACGDDITAYLAQLHAANSRKTYYCHLRGFYQCMVAIGRLELDPTEYVARPAGGDALPDPVEDHELAAALAGSPEQPWRMATILAAYAGMRCCEIETLLREDVTERSVHIRHGKGGKSRYVPTHPVVWQAVRDLPAGPVVHLPGRATPLNPAYLRRRQHVHWRSLGLPGVHMHRFRHWYGTTLCAGGVGIEVVKELMGHSSVTTTMGYVRVCAGRQQQAMAALPVLGLHMPSVTVTGSASSDSS